MWSGGRAVPHLLVGALVNAQAVSEAVAGILAATEPDVTVLACGERWRQPSEDGELRATGYPEDVEHAARLDVYDAVPVMEGDRLTSR